VCSSDLHAHLNDPGFTWREDFPHGSAAAARGGVTTIVDMPLQNVPALTDAGIFAAKEKAIAGRGRVDYAVWGGFVGDNLDELESLDRAGAVAFKAFLGPVSPDYATVGLDQLRLAAVRIRAFDGLLGVHCEDYGLIRKGERLAAGKEKPDWRDFLASRPPEAEILAVDAVLGLARETGVRVHICHVSLPEAAESIRRARADGIRASGETCPHYLSFCDRDLLARGAWLKCAPPLRDAAARERLWEYVADGTLSCLGSDHSPCRPDEKDAERLGVFGAWGGVSGIQTMFQTLFDQGVRRRGLSPVFLARSARETARVFGLDHCKGELRPGLDADLAIFDPGREWEITPSSLEYLNPRSAFVGLRGRGLPTAVFVRGRAAFREGRPQPPPGWGRLVKRRRQADDPRSSFA
jgi:allantoinase